MYIVKKRSIFFVYVLFIKFFRDGEYIRKKILFKIYKIGTGIEK
jgi:hypothetical protein